jgi:tRNA isopentenyl-2-thiomethyl-A-37 hydroxylase MiaE
MGVMGFKEYMDQAGNFITQAEADARVEEMRRVRASLLARLDYKQQAHQKQHDKLVQAHVAVVEEKRHHHVQTTPVMTAPSPQ